MKFIGNEVTPTHENNRSWVLRFPELFACFLLAICLVTSQFNPCDATSVSMGSSLTFILLVMGIGFLVAIDSLLNPSSLKWDRLYQGLVASFFLFGVWLWICTSMVPGRGNARFAINGCWQWIAQGILIISIAKLTTRLRVAASTAALMIGCTAGTVASAALQYFVSMPALRQQFAADPNAFFEKMGLVAGSADAMQMANRLGSLEPTGPFALTNSLAGLVATWLVFIVVLLSGQISEAYIHHQPKKLGWGSAFLTCGLVCIFFVTLLLTKSRSAWLAAIVALLLTCFLHPAIRTNGWNVVIRFRIAMIALVVLVASAMGTVLVRDPMIIAEAGKSISYRFDYWQGAVALVKAEPWTGYGVANFQQNYNRIKLVTASESPADPHNFVLETAVAGGLPLVLILFAILAILIWKMVQVSWTCPVEQSPFGTRASLDTCGLAMIAGAICSCIGIPMFASLVGDSDAMMSSVLYSGFAVAVFLLMHRCKCLVDDRNSAVACLISSAVLWTHLLAAGGWMQPGVMNSLCVLIGLAFGLQGSRVLPNGDEKWAVGDNALKKFTLYPVVCLVLVLVAAVEFGRSMCIPVLAASGAKSLVANNSNAIQDPNQWLELIKLDPLDPDLPSMAAEQLVELLSKTNLSDSTKQKYLALLDTVCDAYLQRDANQWVPYADCGRWNAMVAANSTATETNGDTLRLRKERAYEYYSKSASLYPNSAQTQLQAAVIAAWCGKISEAKTHWSKAEQVDRETPHVDRKLSAVMVFFPKELESKFGDLETEAKLGQAEYGKGEPILRWLRNNVR